MLQANGWGMELAQEGSECDFDRAVTCFYKTLFMYSILYQSGDSPGTPATHIPGIPPTPPVAHPCP
jgi:hypothetical protein